MSWGTRIVILYLSFIGLILSLIFVCMGETTDLESKDYYAKEIAFQGQLDATNNANALTHGIEHEVLDRSVKLILPKEVLTDDFKGTVKFFRPSDSKLDRELALQPDATGILILSPEGLEKGVYRLQLSFSSAHKNYYKEEIIQFR